MKYESSVLEANQWTLECDLMSDVEKLVHTILKLRGYSDEELSKVNDLMLLYFKDQLLFIPPFPRNVRFSRQFDCPPKYKAALEEFVHRAKNGVDLEPFMSERVRKNLDNNDLLLSDWGIYHFHLTRRFRPDGTAKRSEYQIFACCDNDTLYLIQVYRHNKPNLYSQEELLSIVKENWPNLLLKCRCNEIRPLNEKLDDAQRTMLRNSHILTITEIDNEFYFPPGGGYASDGSSIVAVQRRNDLFNTIRLVELQFKNNMSKVLDYIQKMHSSSFNKNLKLTVVGIDRDNLKLFEKNNGLIFVYSLIENSIKIESLVKCSLPHFTARNAKNR